MVKRYKHLFFDLDRTLWDFEKNSTATLQEVFEIFQLEEKGVSSFSSFIEKYIDVNEAMWALYRVGKIQKEELRSIRFKNTLLHFGISDDDLALQIGEYYIKESPLKTNLFPNTIEILEYLREEGYQMHIITNGFEEVQHIKLKNSGLSSFFKEIITSERAGVKKPNSKIFNFSMELAGAQPEESLMLGDDIPVDLHGAKAVGMDQVYFNPNHHMHEEKMTYEVNSLLELKKFL